MDCHEHDLRERWALRILALLSAVLVGLVPWAEPAAAHGSVIDPASRNYGCWLRWGSDFQNPAMQREDPMCWQAWQDDTNAMWNWNGLYRENVGGDHQAFIPDGQLCSAGLTGDGRYRSMDNPGPWRTTDVGEDFTVHLRDQALHGADYLRVYVTRQGFDPTTRRLGWGDLELLETTGRYAPASDILVDVSAPGRTGHHIVYTIWKASHADQVYYICSDVNFS
ncbi:lytic polysaccharide monooxygenase auxiliary activity family 9 protein [Streptomyces sp. TRM 70361]|uniref:lytic polysaccharide monooxygenase auxiliary activity family 9 protein n=1 Tax=Streptomyces sp. TRM 70361 TaxID=3116553 RepID=UPI002E7B7115|nr:lytic polysaccharide monooxygenase auxiliary activity family 9 protein [Streptomyces sp. TRM 70361]MEE1941374.1 lytic polysaccharide monooxygenase auxiliary activity family 9 protein [Streptomyces sp. TRM 70361]